MKKPNLKLFTVTLVIIFLPVFLAAQELEVAADFKLPDTQGQSATLSDYKDTKVVLLLFWTTWCPFCRKELKLLNEKYAELASEGTRVLAINIGEPLERVADFAQRYNLLFRVLLDENSEVAAAYKLLGIPTYIIIDQQGYIRYRDYTFPAKEYKELTARNHE
jgi:peroxiredoxin